MARCMLRLSIHTIQVKSNGDVPEDQLPKDGTNNLLVATLRYPRSGAPSIVSTFPLNLQDNVLQSFDVADFFTSGVFKEEIDTETILKIQVMDRAQPSTFTKVVAALAGAILGAELGGIVGGISNAIVGAVAKLPADAVTSSFKVDDETVTVLGEGEVRLSVGSIPSALTINLTAPADVTKTYYAPVQPGDSKVQRKTTVLLKKGDSLGSVSLVANVEALP
jgi:hypothetical protein